VFRGQAKIVPELKRVWAWNQLKLKTVNVVQWGSWAPASAVSR